MKIVGTIFYAIVVAGCLHFIQVFEAYRLKYVLILSTILYLYLWKK